jgi:hypothetical protein
LPGEEIHERQGTLIKRIDTVVEEIPNLRHITYTGYKLKQYIETLTENQPQYSGIKCIGEKSQDLKKHFDEIFVAGFCMY